MKKTKLLIAVITILSFALATFNAACLYGVTSSSSMNNKGTVLKYHFPTCTAVTFTQSPTLCAGKNIVVGSHTYTVSGTYTDTLTQIVSGCDSIVTTNLTVLPSYTITLTSAAATTTQSVCINTPITNITYTVNAGDTSLIFSGLPAGVSGNYSSGTFTINGTPTVVGTFNYSVSTIQNCTQTVGTITVNPNAAIALTSAAGTKAQTLCINTPITAITYSVSGGGSGAAVTGLPGGVSGSFSNGIVTINGTPSASGTFNYTVTTTGNCNQVSATGTITVNALPTITATSATVCVGSSAILNASGGSTYLWSTGATAAVIGVSPSSTNTYTVTGTSSSGCSSSATCTVTVNPNAAIALTSATGTTTQTLCINTPITVITYSISGGGTNATFAGLPSGVTGAYSGGVATINGTPSASGTFNYTVNTTGTCTQTKATGTIIVNPNAAITLTTNSGSYGQSICINSPLTPVTYTVTGGGTNALISGLPPGISGVYASGKVTISGTPTNIGTYSDTITTTGTCVQTSTAGTIIVNSLPTATITIVGAATACQNAAAPNVLFTAANGTPPYTFTYKINGGSNQTISTTGTNNTVAIAVPTAKGTTYTYSLVSVAGAPIIQPVCPNTVTIQVWGAGGGGGTGGLNSAPDGSGGGGGAFSSSVLSLLQGSVYNLQVGAGGAGATWSGSAMSGGNGQGSWFGSGSTVYAQGGTGGLAVGAPGYTVTTSGGSAAAGYGQIKYSGGAGVAGCLWPGGGGGASACPTANGNNAPPASNNTCNGPSSTSTPGAISACPGLGGAGGVGGESNGPFPSGNCTTLLPTVGGFPGGGGGGGTNGCNSNGAAGGNGQVIITTANGTSTFTNPGSYTWTVPNLPYVACTIAPCTQPQSGSAVITILPITFSISPVICAGQSVTVGVHTYSVSGTYIDTLTSKLTGCDSIVNTTLTIVQPVTYNQTKTVSICSGSSYTFPDGSIQNNITAIVIDTSRLKTKVCGSDSTIITTITIKPIPALNSILNRSILSGNAFTYTPTCVISGATYKWSRATTAGVTEAGTTGIGNINEILIQNSDTTINVIYTYTPTANGCSNVGENITVALVPSPNSQFVTTYTTSGSSTWTAPGCVSTVTVQCWGGGGSGASGGFNGGYFDGGGGGGGAYASSVLSVTPGNTYSLVVGAGGITNCAGNTYVPGQNGGNSAFGSNLVVAAGGGGAGMGGQNVAYVAGLGGAASNSTGTIVNAGGTGGCGGNCSGSIGNGSAGQPGTGNSAGGGGGGGYLNNVSGGAGAGKGGSGGYGGYLNSVGSPPAIAPGGGGGGAATPSTGNLNGANGQVIIMMNSAASLTSSNSATTCSGTTFNYTATSDSSDATFAWQRATAVGISQAGTSGSGNISEVLTNTTPYPVYVVYNYTVTVGGSSCISENVIVKVNPTYNQTKTVAVCSGNSYTFPDGTTQNNITAQVVQTSNLTSHVYGCDSTIVTTVNVNPAYHIADSASICSGSSYTFADGSIQTNITAQMVHTSSLTTTGIGCDSIITTKINIKNNSTYTISPSVCNNYTSPSAKYIWTTSGTYHDTITNAVGCDSLITVNLTIKNSSNTTLTPSVCNSYTSPSGKHTWTTSGIYYDTIPNSVGCDSLMTINLLIKNSASSINKTTCYSYTSPSAKYTWTTSGIYKDTVPNAALCDSLITINLTINTNSNSSSTITACDKYTSPSGKHNWTIGGTYYDTILNKAGCDSLMTINLTINHSSAANKNITTCSNYNSPSGKYVWTTTGTYHDTIPNAAGCDSVITFNIINKNTTNAINASACKSYTSPSGKYTWTTSGTYKDTIPNSVACDSIITVNLSINNTLGIINPAVCYSYTSPSGKYIWITSGTHYDTITNSKGCDSLITINLTIKNSSTGTISPSVCNSYTSPSGKYTWTASGTHKDTIANSKGCDSLITIHLTIKNSSTGTISPVVCNSYTSPSGKYSWTTSGTHKDTILNSKGCDSLITINLTIKQNSTNTISPSVCNSYTSPSGKYIWTASGTHKDTIANAKGCDSLITINLTIKNSSTGAISPIVCNSYTSPSGKYTWTASGTHKDTIANAKGCDSLITINLTIKNSSTGAISPVVCNSYTSPSGKYSWTASGTHKDTIANAKGCDSLITINLTIKNNSTGTISPSVCSSYTSPSGKYIWTASGIHKDTILNSKGCDSLITVNLTIKQNSTYTISPAVCNSYTSPSGKYIWTASGTHKDTILNSRGCDSVITINLTIKNSSTGVISPSVCNSYTSPSGKYSWTTSGTHKDTILNSKGCDSVITINLTIKNSSTGAINPVVCNSYTSPSGKYIWTTSGTHKDTILNSSGCDSVITINLTIKNSSTATISPIACNSYTSPSGKYNWTTSGTHNDTILNAASCDSIITIHLTFKSQYTASQTKTICKGSSYTFPDGTIQTHITTQVVHTSSLITVGYNCDSIITTTVNITTLDTSVNVFGTILTASAAGGSYQWLKCGNNDTTLSGETAQSYSVSATGIYAVALSENGCVDTSACKLIKVIETGISEITSNETNFVIYPNPTNGATEILFNRSLDNIAIRVVNLTGQKVIEKTNLSGNRFSLDISQQSAGAYFIEILENNTILRSKLIKQ
jgi:hypothetical protein